MKKVRAKRLATKALSLMGELQVESSADLVHGMKKTYARGRRCHDKALSRGDDALHELRKRVKYHRYQLRLISPVFRKVLGAERKVAKKISDQLGADHDLAVLEQRLLNSNMNEEQRDLLIALTNRKRCALQRSALKQSALLFAETPKHKSRRVLKYITEARS
jgi:CHAD domain-containing protein